MDSGWLSSDRDRGDERFSGFDGSVHSRHGLSPAPVRPTRFGRRMASTSHSSLLESDIDKFMSSTSGDGRWLMLSGNVRIDRQTFGSYPSRQSASRSRCSPVNITSCSVKSRQMGGGWSIRAMSLVRTRSTVTAFPSRAGKWCPKTAGFSLGGPPMVANSCMSARITPPCSPRP